MSSLVSKSPTSKETVNLKHENLFLTGYLTFAGFQTENKNKSFVFVFAIVLVGILALVLVFVVFGLQQVSLFLHKLGAIICGGSFLFKLWLNVI